MHDTEFFEPSQAEEMIKRAHKNNVQKIICIGTDLEDSVAACEFASKHDNVYWTYGIHPENYEKASEIVFSRPWRPMGQAELESHSGSRRSRPSPRGERANPRAAALRNPPSWGSNSACPIAIGEIGLDYHSDGYNREAQIKLFEQMLQLAQDNDLPVSFHVRNAFEDFFAVTANFPKIRGVVHSFTDSKKVLKRIVETTDYFIGVNGLATYSTLPTPPLERILLETDAPFLTPVPFRGIINEPAYVYNIAEWLSQKFGVEFEKIEKETTSNAERLYNFQNTKSTANTGE
ncbi:TatD family hydrolase [Candidatus Saccharibacteria bacterium]|nr:TatD family hydrolase [Candidatus Saccharibacteria bacterium]